MKPTNIFEAFAIGFWDWQPERDPQPTAVPRGPGRVAVYAARVAAGQETFCDRDFADYAGPPQSNAFRVGTSVRERE